MTLEKAIEILDVNVICSPKSYEFKEAVGVVEFTLEYQQAVINNLKNDCSVVEVNLEEAFLKECECEIEKAREQAVREFAKKLKEAFNNLAYDANTHRKALRLEVVNSQMNWVLHDVTAKEIDKLFDKMFPEQKGENNV